MSAISMKISRVPLTWVLMGGWRDDKQKRRKTKKKLPYLCKIQMK